MINPLFLGLLVKRIPPNALACERMEGSSPRSRPEPPIAVFWTRVFDLDALRPAEDGGDPIAQETLTLGSPRI